MRCGFLILVSFFISICAFSQDREALVQQRIEFISEQLESEEIDLTDVIQYLYFRLDNPLNLNNADKQSLRELNLLTDIQINDLLLHRERFGKLISIYELQSLKFWDLNTIFLVMPFIKVDDKFDQLHVSFREALKRGDFEWWARYQRNIEQKKGYTPVSDSVMAASKSYYQGNPDK